METKLRIGTAILLWAVSGLMAMGLYINFAGPVWYQIPVAVALSAGLETAKILAWRKGGWSRLIALGLSFLTLLAILGTSLTTIEARKADSIQARMQGVQATKLYQDLTQQQTLLKGQENALLAQMKAMPSDWVSLNLRVSGELRMLQSREDTIAQRIETLEQVGTTGAKPEAPRLFRSLGRVIGQPEETTELFVLLVLACMVEVSAFAMSGSNRNPNPRPTSDTETNVTTPETTVVVSPKPYEPKRSPKPESGLTAGDYLTAATDHPRKPFLLGRGPVAQRLGITEARAKELVEELVRDGRVRRESKYFISV